jgi:hypothetical protein
MNESEEQSLNIAEELMLYLRWFAPFNCSEQHDRFYGILGLLQHTSLPIVLAPNYQKKPEVVFREYTLYILKETKFFNNILSARSWPNHSEWPSWVPNWKGSFSLHFGLGRNAYLEVLLDDTKIEVDCIVLSNILTTAPAGVCEVPRVLEHSENPGNSSTLLYWAITCILDHLSQVMQNLFGGPVALDELPPVTVETLVRALSKGVELSTITAAEIYRELLSGEIEVGEARLANPRFTIDLTEVLNHLMFLLASHGLVLADNDSVYRTVGDAEKGDSICILKGSSQNLILRSCGTEWRLIGSCTGVTDAFTGYEFQWRPSDSEVEEYYRRWDDLASRTQRIVIC